MHICCIYNYIKISQYFYFYFYFFLGGGGVKKAKNGFRHFISGNFEQLQFFNMPRPLQKINGHRNTPPIPLHIFLSFVNTLSWVLSNIELKQYQLDFQARRACWNSSIVNMTYLNKDWISNTRIIQQQDSVREALVIYHKV